MTSQELGQSGQKLKLNVHGIVQELIKVTQKLESKERGKVSISFHITFREWKCSYKGGSPTGKTVSLYFNIYICKDCREKYQ